MFVHVALSMYMTFRRLRAWPGFVDYVQQSWPATFLTIIFTILIFFIFVDGIQLYERTTQLPVMGVSARTTMKGAAKCNKHGELQDSVNQQKVERILLFRVILESMFASVSFVFLRGVSLGCHVFVFSFFNVAFVALPYVSWWCWTCATLNIFFRSDVTCDQAAPVCIF